MKPQRIPEIKKMLCSCQECKETNGYFAKLRDLGDDLNKNEDFNRLIMFASALSSKDRLIILRTLKGRDKCVCELEVVLNKSQSTISHHIGKLLAASLIEGYKKGNFTYYHLLEDNLKSQIEILNRELQV